MKQHLKWKIEWTFQRLVFSLWFPYLRTSFTFSYGGFSFRVLILPALLFHIKSNVEEQYEGLNLWNPPRKRKSEAKKEMFFHEDSFLWPFRFHCEEESTGHRKGMVLVKHFFPCDVSFGILLFFIIQHGASAATIRKNKRDVTGKQIKR